MGLKPFVALFGLAGFALVVIGLALIHPPVAMVVAGALLLALAWLTLDAMGAAR